MKKLIFLLIFSCFLGMNAQQEFRVLGELPAEASENSGMVLIDDELFLHNDSGNSANLQVVDTTSLQLLREIQIENAINVDWEDMGMDDTHLYLADIGNFNGDRQDLVIYRVPREELSGADPVSAEIISFSYADQQDFTPSDGSDWDAEALVVMEDRLLIFTKQWQQQQVKAYSLPKAPGTHEAQPLDSYDSKGLVTGAGHDPVTGIIYLSGYTEFLSPFIIRIEGATTTSVFGGTVARSDLDLSIEQVEAIAPVGEGEWFFSSEAIDRSNPPIQRAPRLFAFKNTVEDPDPDPDPDPELPIIMPLPDLTLYADREQLQYRLGIDGNVTSRALYNTSGQLLKLNDGPELLPRTFTLPVLPSGVYYFSLMVDGRRLAKPFAIP